MVSTLPGGRSPRPAGIAQLGYACFWPNGGGLIEGGQIPKVAANSLENDDDESGGARQVLQDHESGDF